MSTGMETLRAIVAARHDPAALAPLIDSDAPVAAYLDSGFPEELAIAAGFRPMLLTGDLTASTPQVDDFLDLAVPGRVRALLSGLVTGSYGTPATLCVTGGDSWLAGVQDFLASHEVLTGVRIIPDVFFLQRVRGRYRHHREYILAELVAYRAHLAKISGREVTDDAIAAAITQVNATRSLIREVSSLRHRANPALSGVDAMTIVLAAMIMPGAQFNTVVRSVLDTELGSLEAPAEGLPRIHLSGTALDHTGLHATVESLGAVVVGEDHEFGERYAVTVVDESIDPIEALADRVALGYPEPWSFGRGNRIRRHVESAREAAPDAQIFFHVKGDQGVGWDFPDQRKALEEGGIPVLPLIDQTYDLAHADLLREQIAEFLGALKRRGAA